MGRKGKSNPRRGRQQDPRQLFQEINRLQYDKCLAGPLHSCGQPAIRAHSIQNSASAMGLIATDGHVVMIKRRLAKDRLALNIESVGRNQATTFAGLCARHDNDIFRPLDTTDLDPSNDEHLFLLDYRALLREQQVLMTGGLQFQRLAELGGTSAQMSAFKWQVNAFFFDEYRRTYFDPVMQSRDFGKIEHDVLLIETAPTVAVSSVFSLDELDHRGDVLRSALSVLPISPKQSVAAFSYPAAEAGPARQAIEPVIRATGPQQALELSRLIIDRTENFILSPTFVAEWDGRKKTAVSQAFSRSIFTYQQSPLTDALMLFQV